MRMEVPGSIPSLALLVSSYKCDAFVMTEWFYSASTVAPHMLSTFTYIIVSIPLLATTALLVDQWIYRV